MRIAIIGGGAAGFFSAIHCKENYPSAQVTIYEKTDKLLTKVRVSGGGRCNVTHACFSPSDLARNYPRGERQLKKAFARFSTRDTVKWFEDRGVALKTESDNRMFPVTDSSQSIINCLTSQTYQLGIEVKQKSPISSIAVDGEAFLLNDEIKADKVIITTGGGSKIQHFDWLAQLGHNIEPPVPSLFTFNMPEEDIRQLMGLSVQNASVKIQGTKLKAIGPILMTHWGMSGPAVLKLSAFGARMLHEMGYHFKVQVHWLGDASEADVQGKFREHSITYPKRKVINKNPFGLPHRLWEFLLAKVDIRHDILWGELGKKGRNKLINILINDIYQVSGKTTFKEEFVTCGGVSLQDVDFNTMESKKCPGLYFAGEVLDIDGVTGGFNFQGAWTTAYIAARLTSSLSS